MSTGRYKLLDLAVNDHASVSLRIRGRERLAFLDRLSTVDSPLRVGTA